MSSPEIDSIERETRQHCDDPIIAIAFEKRKRSGRVNHAVVQVKVLSRCDGSSAGGRIFYFRRVKHGWRFDPKRDGKWASVTDVVPGHLRTSR